MITCKMAFALCIKTEKKVETKFLATEVQPWLYLWVLTPKSLQAHP